MRDDNLFRASEGCDSVAELARILSQADPHNENAPANRFGQEGSSHHHDESPPLAPADQLPDDSSAREQAYERDEHRHDDGISKRAHDQRDRAEDVTNVADEEYTIEALRTPKRRLVLVIAIFGLAVAGSGVAFGYRAMFGGLTSPTLPPINQTSKGSKEIVRTSSDVQANHNASPAGAVTTDSVASLVSHGGSLPGMGAPATPISSAVGQTMPNQAMPVGLAGGANSPWPPAVTAASGQAAAPTATLAPRPSPEARAASSSVHVAAVAPASANSAPAVASYGSGGGYTVQITAERSESKARAEFRALQAKYRNQLSGRHAIIRRADLGTKGTYYRALVGPFASVQEAGRWCSGFMAAGGNCRVQRN